TARVARAVLIAAGILTFSLFVHFFYQYTWTERMAFGEPSDVVLYYILPLLLSIFLLVSLKLKAAHQINIVVFGAACIASAYGAELLLSFFPISTQRTVMSRLQDASDKKKYAADLKRKFGIDVDTRTGIEVLEDLKESGIDAVPIVTPSNHLFLEQA